MIIRLNVFSIVTEHFDDYTSKLSGHEVILDGISAIKVGLGYIIFRLVPISTLGKNLVGPLVYGRRYV